MALALIFVIDASCSHRSVCQFRHRARSLREGIRWCLPRLKKIDGTVTFVIGVGRRSNVWIRRLLCKDLEGIQQKETSCMSVGFDESRWVGSKHLAARWTREHFAKSGIHEMRPSIKNVTYNAISNAENRSAKFLSHACSNVETKHQVLVLPDQPVCPRI